jgi:hypothetical protein
LAIETKRGRDIDLTFAVVIPSERQDCWDCHAYCSCHVPIAAATTVASPQLKDRKFGRQQVQEIAKQIGPTCKSFVQDAAARIAQVTEIEMGSVLGIETCIQDAGASLRMGMAAPTSASQLCLDANALRRRAGNLDPEPARD